MLLLFLGKAFFSMAYHASLSPMPIFYFLLFFWSSLIAWDPLVKKYSRPLGLFALFATSFLCISICSRTHVIYFPDTFLHTMWPGADKIRHITSSYISWAFWNSRPWSWVNFKVKRFGTNSTINGVRLQAVRLVFFASLLTWLSQSSQRSH